MLGGPSFGIVVDGDLVPRDPLEALLQGAAPGVDLLLGWTSEEYRLWLVPGGLLERVDRLGAVAVAGAMARCRCGHEVPRGYRAIHPAASTGDLVGQMVTDHLLRVPLHRLADARRGHSRSYAYEFAWPSNVPRLGACHALELGFVFDTAEVPESAMLVSEGAPRTRRGHARGLGAVRGRGRPRLAGLGHHPSGTGVRRGGTAHRPRATRP